MAEAKTKRNLEIYQARKSGVSVKELKEKYDVSSVLIRSICKKEEEKEQNQTNLIYQMIVKYCDDERFCTRTFNVLQRLEAVSEEEILKLNRKYLLHYARNCGEKMVDLIEKIQAEIRSRNCGE